MKIWKFFAHQHHAIQPDIITIAKGMGKIDSIGGTLIATTFFKS
jgi:acetylornithine aminotransferase